jgi:peptidoglycan/xylan/chitin deacetylase (PgdA/CDA1 family)
MLARRVYYTLKPIIPRSIRMTLRRWRALRILEECKEIWPIDASAGKPPRDWPGWPRGKRFAVILTHDVEGSAGYSRVRQLMDLEKRLGFRSSFNFVPEGQYRLQGALRDELVQEGFEVGVHDLRHDGKLYRSERGFHKQAERINHYLREWNAVGFRSAFMLHNLEWQAELEALYDASTFDTDPFEPQPDGVGTIFPFWVPGHAGRPGYAELPYTLVQDSTLFLLMRKKTIAVWQEKLDWIANCGGMALVIVHPDYIDFAETGRPSRKLFPASWYSAFLHLLKTKYHDEYWAALPREVANYVSRHRSILTAPACVLRSLS